MPFKILAVVETRWYQRKDKALGFQLNVEGFRDQKSLQEFHDKIHEFLLATQLNKTEGNA